MFTLFKVLPNDAWLPLMFLLWSRDANIIGVPVYLTLWSSSSPSDQTSSMRLLNKSFVTTPLEKAMAPHSSTLAWKIPWMEEPGRLQSMGSPRVDWATSLSLFTFMHWRRKWQPTPVFLPGESQGWRTWWAAIYGVAQSWTQLKWLSSSNSSRKLFNASSLVTKWEYKNETFVWVWLIKKFRK